MAASDFAGVTGARPAFLTEGLAFLAGVAAFAFLAGVALDLEADFLAVVFLAALLSLSFCFPVFFLPTNLSSFFSLDFDAFLGSGFG